MSVTNITQHEANGKDETKNWRITHGMSTTVTYRAWQSMRQRCYDKSVANYPKYGGIGISVCERWRNSFENFLEDMGERPSDGHSLDRYPNQSGNYEPGNCRWATAKEQSRNIKTNRILYAFGKSQSVSAWAEEMGIDRSVIYARLQQNRGGKWTAEEILTRPVQKYIRKQV